MPFSALVEHYLARNSNVRPGTSVSRDNIIRSKILPYFSNYLVTEISDNDIRKWQDELGRQKNPKTGKPYSETYLQKVALQLRAIMNFAVSEYGLEKNPSAKIAGSFGRSGKEIRFWTVEEYRRFSLAVKETNPVYYYCFEILYWAGISEGEVLALTPDDVDLSGGTLSITKVFQSVRGKEIIGLPSSSRALRKVHIPNTLCREIEYYITECSIKSGERLFPFTKSALNKAIKRWSALTGTKQIRVDDLRNSHVIMLIRNGFGAEAIAQRTGHEGITISRKYAAFFPAKEDDVAAVLDRIMQEVDTVHI